MEDRSSFSLTSTIPRRAWSDFQHQIRTQRFTLFAIVFGAIGAGVGALAPPNATPAQRFLFAAIAAFGAPLLAYTVALVWAFLSAPYRQRRDLIDRQTAVDRSPMPIMKLIPEVRSIKHKPGYWSSDWIQSIALVRVFNAQERGDDRATARNVVPEVEVFGPDGKCIHHRKGWAGSDSRDFTTGQEEEQLRLAATHQQRRGFSFYNDRGDLNTERVDDGVYKMTITLRGQSDAGPLSFSKDLFLSSGGADGDLTLIGAEPSTAIAENR